MTSSGTFICALRKGESLKAVNKNQDRLLWYYIPLHSIMHVSEEKEEEKAKMNRNNVNVKERGNSE